MRCVDRCAAGAGEGESMTASIQLANITISDAQPPHIIAEIGANHDGSVEKAAELVRAIARSGARLVKFQHYVAEELVADLERETTWGPPHHRVRERVGDMFRRLSLPRTALRDLFAEARALGLEPFATPFSEQGADELMELDVACFKVAASDVTHLPLLGHLARLGRPVFLSLGKCTLGEADTAIQHLLDNGCRALAILHCVATYPSPMEEMNLRVIPQLRALYPECVVGFSDHSVGTTAAVAAVALGARLIEKHVTLDKATPGPDHWFSLDMNELAALVKETANAYSALGTGRKRVLACEQHGKAYATRSLVARRAIAAGERLTRADLKIVRPGTGLAPSFMDVVIGMELKRALSPNEVLTWSHFRAQDPS